MSDFSRRPTPWIWSAPLLSLLLAACDNPPPAFREETIPLGAGTVYGSDDALAEDGTNANKDDHTAEDRGEEEASAGAVATARWSFQASTLAEANFSLQLDNGLVEQRMTMDNNVVATRLDFQQLNRPVTTEVFKQGSEEEQLTENFEQSAQASGLLDVLLVVDNSGSMKEEQQNLSNKLLPLLSYVKESDWKIGVVTTDPNNGCLRGLMRKGEANVEKAFADAVNAGTSGSGNERGILQAVNGLKGECNQTGSWLRSQSTVAVLIVSDEDNCSAGKDCGSDPWASSAYLLDYLSSIRQLGTNARVYGIVWHPSTTQSACNTGANKANIYADAVDRSSGSWGSICDKDYSKTLSAISYDLSVILKTQFALREKPYANTLKVFVNNQMLSSGYKLTGNVLEFTSPPAAGAKVRVEYEFSREPPKQEFFLAAAADQASLQVFLDGAPTQAFSYDAGAKSIRFTDAPMVQEIKTVYRKAGELKTDFSIGKAARSSSIRVSVNGQNVSQFSYSAQTGLVRFSEAPRDAAAIAISFDEVLSPNLRYPIFAAEAVRDELKAYDAKTKLSVRFSLDGDMLVFPLNQFQANRQILLVYPLGPSQGLNLYLGQKALVDSVEVKGSKTGVCLGKNLRVQGFEVDMSACGFVEGETLSVRYAYAKEHLTSFNLGSIDLDLSQYEYKVKVNGVENKDFQIFDQVLSFPQLAFNAKVEVELYKK